MSDMKTCGCGRKFCVIVYDHCNYSYFEAPKGGWHSSDYSGILCLKCGLTWRSKAKWIDTLHILTGDEHSVWAINGHVTLRLQLNRDRKQQPKE